MGCKWIFKRKEGILRVEDIGFKAHLVAMGYSQIEKVDFNDVFSPVIKHSSIQVFLVLVVMHDLDLKQLHMEMAFLYDELEDNLCTSTREFQFEGKEDHICLLKKCIYHLKQSHRHWYKMFDTFMVQPDYCKSKYDSCVYLCKLPNDSFIFLLLYVDNMLIATKYKSDI